MPSSQHLATVSASRRRSSASRTTTTRKPKYDSSRPATEWKGSGARQSIDVTYIVPVQAAAAGSKEFANERTALNA